MNFFLKSFDSNESGTAKGKDKDLYNKNVLLGTGMVDFKKVFEAFNDIDYRGPFTFETTRGSDPVNTAKYNINFAKFFIKNAELSV